MTASQDDNHVLRTLARLAAAPLSEPALTSPLQELDPNVDGRTADLWRRTELEEVEGRGLSVDELTTLRDLAWFGDQPAHDEVPLEAFLANLAEMYLTPRGQVSVPDLGDAIDPRDAPRRARWAWRWLTFHLPPKSIVQGHPGQPGPLSVQLLSERFRDHLERSPYAETHLHMGAGARFQDLWVSALLAVARNGVEADGWAFPSAPLEEGRQLVPWILQGAVVRWLLAGFLAQDRRDSLASWLDHRWDDFRALGGPSAVRVLRRALSALLEGRLYGGIDAGREARSPPLLRLRRVYRDLVFAPRGFSPEQIQCPGSRPLGGDWDARDHLGLDPIAPFSPPQGPHDPPEAWFQAKGLEHIRSGDAGRAFRALFWQCVRLHVVFYRHVTQRPDVKGLQWFIRFYGRLSPVRQALDPYLVRENALVSGLGTSSSSEGGLASLETRTSPGSSVKAVVSQLRNLARSASVLLEEPGSTPELGLVLHFTKDRGGGDRQGETSSHWTNTHADPTPDSPGGTVRYRYSDYYRDRRAKALAIGRTLLEAPASIHLLRGFDVCTDERAIPTWVLKPLFRYVQEAGRQASQVLSRHAGIPVSPPRTTVHVGEDWTHLAGGLRRITEALEHLGLRDGDRLGHAMALGRDPRTWVEDVGRVAVPRGEYLMNLLWEWKVTNEHGVGVPGGRGSTLYYEVERLSEAVFGEPHTPGKLLQFRRCLFSEVALRRAGFPDGPRGLRPAADGSTQDLVRRYLRDPGVFDASRRLEWVEPNPAVLESLQHHLQRRLQRRGITVETNPSSNLLIGDLDDLTEHPFFRISSEEHGAAVRVCIGSDDPITFATTLPGEYQLLLDSLVRSGFSEREARRRIDRFRENGMDARFTQPGDPQGLLRRLTRGTDGLDPDDRGGPGQPGRRLNEERFPFVGLRCREARQPPFPP